MENNDENNNMITDSQLPQNIANLVQSLEQAISMAKQLPSTSNPDHRRHIFTSLSSAQLSISSFLSLHHNNIADNSVSSAADEPMMIGGDDDDEEQNSRDYSMENVEEKMRELFYIQNKRQKRSISPSSAAFIERQRFKGRENVRVPVDFDLRQSRLRDFDLVFQFHA
ncbi:unnamed protein product [Amaranthus hypochondriacus]